MKKWYVKNLGEANFADDALERIKALFLDEYEKRGKPNDMAIFIRHESEGRLHCEVKIYFSPETNAIAQNVGAVPCAKPSFDGLDIFTGTKKAWPILFSGNGQ